MARCVGGAPETLALLGPAIRALSSLATLRLRDCGLGADGGAALKALVADPAAAADSLRHLDLASNAIGPEGGRLIGSSLGRLGGLVSLDVGFNELGEEGCAALAEGAAAHGARWRRPAP